jgi:hypothetical protein
MMDMMFLVEKQMIHMMEVKKMVKQVDLLVITMKD